MTSVVDSGQIPDAVLQTLGADGYVEKPIDTRRLHRMLRELSPEERSDLRVAVPLGRQLQHLALTRRQRLLRPSTPHALQIRLERARDRSLRRVRGQGPRAGPRVDGRLRGLGARSRG